MTKENRNKNMDIIIELESHLPEWAKASSGRTLWRGRWTSTADFRKVPQIHSSLRIICFSMLSSGGIFGCPETHREEVVILELLSIYKSPRESDLTRAATNLQTSHNSEVVTGGTQNSAEASSVFCGSQTRY